MIRTMCKSKIHGAVVTEANLHYMGSLTIDRKLMEAATKAAEKGIMVQHGMQRRSDLGWASAMAWVNEGHIGKKTLSHALVHGLRMSIGQYLSSGEVRGRLHGFGDPRSESLFLGGVALHQPR